MCDEQGHATFNNCHTGFIFRPFVRKCTHVDNVGKSISKMLATLLTPPKTKPAISKSTRDANKKKIRKRRQSSIQISTSTSFRFPPFFGSPPLSFFGPPLPPPLIFGNRRPIQPPSSSISNLNKMIMPVHEPIQELIQDSNPPEDGASDNGEERFN
ncbi:unnamed protein product [Gordionus sp. m RMFG-2023]